jgi:crotonobetainyl-CoA hydratase
MTVPAPDTDGVLVVRDQDAVRVLTLNRPHVLNAVDSELGTALHDALVAADADPAVRCILITGAGERAFCAGGDLKELAAIDGGMPGGGRVITRPLRYLPSKPLLAAASGPAYGGGVEILLACDLVVCAEHATFALPEVRRSLIAAGGGLVRLPQLIGPRRAMQLILTGAPIDAATALDWGLVNVVAPSGTELDVALELARTVAANAPLAVQLSKRTILAAMTSTDAEAWQVNEEAAAALSRSPDAQEGPRAFAEGRPPVWSGLES